MLTKDDCKKIIYRVGTKLKVSPKLIASRLLDDLDKSDMLVAGINIEALEAHIKAWIASGMPDYANGLTDYGGSDGEAPKT